MKFETRQQTRMLESYGPCINRHIFMGNLRKYHCSFINGWVARSQFQKTATTIKRIANIKKIQAFSH